METITQSYSVLCIIEYLTIGDIIKFFSFNQEVKKNLTNKTKGIITIENL